MTIASQTSRISYTGNSSITEFAIPFFFAANADIVVYLTNTAGTQTLQVLGTDYTLIGETLSAGGACTFTIAPTTGYTVVIYRDPALTQTTSYNDNDPFPASSHERALDKALTIDQRTRDLVTRAIHQAEGEAVLTMELAAVATRKNKLLGFGASGELLYLNSNFATAGIGYATGAGGVVTQITSRTTGVTLNTVSGAITLVAAAPAVGTWVSCTVTNSTVAATDTVIVSVKSGTNTYIAHVTAVAAGSFRISFTSIAGTASDSPVINFNIIKGVTS